MSSFNTDLKQILHSSNVSGRSIDASQWRRVMACESKEELERAAISIALERDPVAESPKIRASPEKNKIVETKQQKQQQNAPRSLHNDVFCSFLSSGALHNGMHHAKVNISWLFSCGSIQLGSL